jgi:hypothetical protein
MRNKISLFRERYVTLHDEGLFELPKGISE